MIKIIEKHIVLYAIFWVATFVLGLLSCNNTDDIEQTKKIENKENDVVKDSDSTLSEAGPVFLYDYCGWDRTYLKEDGSTWFSKYSNFNDSLMAKEMFLLNDDSLGLIYGYIQYDEFEMPTYISYNGISIVIDEYNEDFINADVVVGDTLILSFDTLKIHDLSKSWKQKTRKQKIATVGNVVKNAIGIGSGTLMIFGGVTATMATGGFLTPGGLVAVGAGVYTLGSSIEKLHNTINDIIDEKYYEKETKRNVNDEVLSHLMDIECEKIKDMYNTKKITDDYIDMILKNTDKNPNKLAEILKSKNFNATTMLLTLSFDAMDAIWGGTISTEETLIQKCRNCKIITGTYKDVTKHSATLNGYVSSEFLSNTASKYGFIVRLKSDNTPVDALSVENGVGELFSIECNNLKECTQYTYRAFVVDYTDGGFIKFGKTNCFMTDGVPAEIYKASSYNNVQEPTGDITYNIKVNLKLENDSDVVDWGFYYMEDDLHKSFSLKGKKKGLHEYNFSYKTNSHELMLMMGTYVKYGSEGNMAHYGDSKQYYFTSDGRDGIYCFELKDFMLSKMNSIEPTPYYVKILDYIPNFDSIRNGLWFDTDLNLESCSGLKEIPDSALSYCNKLKSIILPKSINRIGKNAFEGCKIVQFSLPEKVSIIDNHAFANSSLQSITLPKNLNIIGEGAFSCSNLSSITIPEQVNIVNKNAFSSCKKLCFVVFIGNTKKIDSYAFSYCDNLTSVTLPESLESIEFGAFYRSSLTSIVIPEHVKNIGDCAFQNCPLTSITLKPKTPPSLGNFLYDHEGDRFTYFPGSIYIPSSSLSEYKSAIRWRFFADQMVGY